MRSLAIHEKVHGSDHPKVALVLNNLAMILKVQVRTVRNPMCSWVLNNGPLLRVQVKTAMIIVAVVVDIGRFNSRADKAPPKIPGKLRCPICTLILTEVQL